MTTFCRLRCKLFVSYRFFDPSKAFVKLYRKFAVSLMTTALSLLAHKFRNCIMDVCNFVTLSKHDINSEA
jgi:hypothetical protein